MRCRRPRTTPSTPGGTATYVLGGVAASASLQPNQGLEAVAPSGTTSAGTAVPASASASGSDLAALPPLASGQAANQLPATASGASAAGEVGGTAVSLMARSEGTQYGGFLTQDIAALYLVLVVLALLGTSAGAVRLVRGQIR